MSKKKEIKLREKPRNEFEKELLRQGLPLPITECSNCGRELINCPHCNFDFCPNCDEM